VRDLGICAKCKYLKEVNGRWICGNSNMELTQYLPLMFCSAFKEKKG